MIDWVLVGKFYNMKYVVVGIFIEYNMVWFLYMIWSVINFLSLNMCVLYMYIYIIYSLFFGSVRMGIKEIEILLKWDNNKYV